ncbi:MAG TPA: PIN domain-containing protein [Chloroflexota bacterium]|nr:PIN domain-containing protein [Chloroflexota bacterium]
MATFADTSALFALLNRSDRHHPEAARAAQQVRDQREPLWTIDAVAVELWRLLRAAAGRQAADRLLQGLAAGGLAVEPVAREDYARAWQLGQDWPDQDFALTDRLCFAAMERVRAFRAWSYDADFAVIRLGPTRSRALDLLY